MKVHIILIFKSFKIRRVSTSLERIIKANKDELLNCKNNLKAKLVWTKLKKRLIN